MERVNVATLRYHLFPKRRLDQLREATSALPV
jgi:hypothetical protein